MQVSYKLPIRFSEKRFLRKQKGQSMVEYIVVVAALIVALSYGDPSVMQQMGDAISKMYSGYSYGISVSELPDAPMDPNYIKPGDVPAP